MIHSNVLLKSVFIFGAISTFACTSKAPENSNHLGKEELSPRKICLLKEQNQKKSIYDSLPELLKRISGNSQIIAESSDQSLPINPTKKDLEHAISLVEETKDVTEWGTEKEGHSQTVSAYVIRPSEWSSVKSKENISLFSISVGQPGRLYQIPLTWIRPDRERLVANVDEYFLFMPNTGMPSERKQTRAKIKTQIKISPIDQRHVLILVRDQSPNISMLNFTRRYSLLLRTYPHLNFDANDQWQEWPVYGTDETNSACDSLE